jgi:ankyrin repeat protein
LLFYTLKRPNDSAQKPPSTLQWQQIKLFLKIKNFSLKNSKHLQSQCLSFIIELSDEFNGGNIMRFYKSVFLSLISFALLSLNAMDQKILNNMLIDTIFNGDLKETKALLEQGANINATNRYGWTPLIRAIQRKHTDIVKYLLQQTDPKVDINAADNDGRTALIEAAQSGNAEVVELLLQQTDPKVNINAKDKKGQTAFMLIGGNNDTSVKIMELFLEQINPKDPTTRLIDINAKDKQGMTPLILAAIYKGKSPRIVTVLLEQRDPMVDINAKNSAGETALMWAAQMSNTKIIETLLEQRNPTDPTIRWVSINDTDKKGKTALIWAAIRSASESVKTLLNQGRPEINIYATDEKGKTALGYALSLDDAAVMHERDIPVVKLLLNAMGEDLDNPELAPLVQKEIRQSLEQLNLHVPENMVVLQQFYIFARQHPEEFPGLEKEIHQLITESLEKINAPYDLQSIKTLDAFHLFARQHPEEFPGLEMKINRLKTNLAAKYARLRRAGDARTNPDAIKATETEDAAGNKTTTDYMKDKSTFDKMVDYLRKLR